MKKKRPVGAVATNAFSVSKSIASGLCVGVAVWAVLLFSASLVISKADEPEKFILPAVFCLAGVSSFTAGFTAERLSHSKSVIPGAVCGGLLLLAVWAVSLFISNSDGEASTAFRVILAADFAFLASVGSVCGRKNTGKRRHTKR